MLLCAVQQWVFIRYAVLSTLKRSELLDMLQRRHELAMACVARKFLDTAEEMKQSNQQQSAIDPSHHIDDHTTQQTSPDGSSNTESTPQPSSFAMQENETFKQWVERLCDSLPVIYRSRAYQAHVSQGGSRVTVAAPPFPEAATKQRELIEQKRVLPGTNRVTYHPKLPFTQFVAAVGMQLLAHASRSKDGSLPKMAVLVECMLAIEVLLYCYC